MFYCRNNIFYSIFIIKNKDQILQLDVIENNFKKCLQS